MSEDSYIFFGNISWICPACGSKTIYRRRGYDGTEGEGQFCEKCGKFLYQIVPKLGFPPPMTMIKFSIYRKNRDYIQQQINEAYKGEETK